MVWSRSKKILALTLGSISIVIACALIYFVLNFPNLGAPQIPFNSTEWKAEIKSDSQVRMGMVDDLLKNYIKIGMHRNEVLQLLGPKDERFGYYLRDPDLTDGYYLGTAHDPCHLYIEYDSKKLVKKIYERCT